MKRLALLLVLVPALAFADTGTSSLESKAIAAFGDIAKAKTALDQGKSKTGDSWLTKAKTLLSSLLQQKEGGQPAAQQEQSAGNSQQQSPQQDNPSALSRAESAAKNLDPSLAGKLGSPDKGGQAQAGSSDSSSTVSDLKSVYDKVSLAQSLLHKGDSTQAKSILSDIPTSPADALKLLHH
jgi:hypothetical protein